MAERMTVTLQRLLQSGRTLVLASAPGVVYARMMERAGVDCFFVGTDLIIGTLTGLPDGGAVTLQETVWLDGFIARAVNIPVIADGDTGFGSILAMRRAIGDLIRAGVAGVRFEDQAAVTKRGVGSPTVELAPLDEAVARVRCAVLTKKELDPDFVCIAKTDANSAPHGGGFEEAMRRLKAYKQAGADVLMFGHPHSVEEIRQARARLDGPLIIGSSPLPEVQTVEEHQALGLAIAWYSDLLAFHQSVTSWDYLEAVRQDGWKVYLDFKKKHKDHPHGRVARDASAREIRRLEEMVWSAEAMERLYGSGKTDKS